MRYARLTSLAAVPALYVLYHWLSLQLEAARSAAETFPFIGGAPIGGLLSVLALAVIGGTLSWALHDQLIGPWVVAVPGLVALPWLFPLSPIDSMAGPLVVVALVSVGVGVVEPVIRDHESFDDFRLRGHWAALVVGLIHVAVGVGFHALSRGLGTWFDTTLVATFFGAGILGTFLAGVLPVYLWRRYSLRTPVILLLLWAAWGVTRASLYAGDLPLTEFSALRLFVVRPFPDYLLGWPVLLFVLLVFAGIESLIRDGTTTNGSGGLDVFLK
jgi:hypothetical protein